MHNTSSVWTAVTKQTQKPSQANSLSSAQSRGGVGLSLGPGVYQLERGHRALCTCASVSSPVETVLGQTGYGGAGVEGECPRKEAVEVFQKTEMYAGDRMVRLTGEAQNILQNRHMYLTLTL